MSDSSSGLTGERPGVSPVAVAEPPSPPEILGIGLPADLLVRRADVRAAERSYAAAIGRHSRARLTSRTASVAVSRPAVRRSFDSWPEDTGLPTHRGGVERKSLKKVCFFVGVRQDDPVPFRFHSFGV